MNRLGFISEIGGKFYSVILSRQAVPVLESDMRKELVAAYGDGLDGIVVVSANQRCILTWDHFGLER